MNARVAMVLALAACTNAAPPGAMLPQSPALRALGGSQHHVRLSRVRFFIRVPARHLASKPARGERMPQFIPARAASIVITLASVNGAPPPTGIATSATTSLTACTSGCTVFGPSAPIGSDAFGLAIYDGPDGTQNQLATGSVTLDVVVGQANSGNVTMEGIPQKFALAGTMPTATGNVPFASAAALPVEVEDADGDVITGTFAQAVTIADSDATALGSGLTLTGAGGSCAVSAKSVQLGSSTDAGNLALCYGGFDITPATLSATTALVTAPAPLSTFAPTIPAIQYTGTLNASNEPEIDLYVPNGPGGGSGSFGSWTDAQPGWTNAPYGMSIGEKNTCDGNGTAISSVTLGGSPSGTSLQANALATPSPGTCSVTLTGGAGAVLAVTVTYTTLGVGVNARRLRPPSPRRRALGRSAQHPAAGAD